MRLGLILSVVAALFVQTAACAQFAQQIGNNDKPQVADRNFYNEILNLATEKSNITTEKSGHKLDFSTTAVRGGSDSGKQLGCYLNGNNTIYRSRYAQLKPEDWATWTCALRDFLQKNGGGWDAYRSYVGAQPQTMTSNDLLNPTRDTSNDPWDRSFVPYQKQEEFAKNWWSHYNPEFRKMGFVWKDWWINDAILDGNVLIGREHLRNRGSADGVMYEDSVLAKLLKKE